MNLRVIVRVLGAILLVVGVAMMTSALVAWLMGDSAEVIFRLTASSLVPMLLGGLGLRTSTVPMEVRIREGFAIVTLSWIGASLSGAIPYVWAGHFTWVDAIFETMSGFTTTGASILSDIEALPWGLLYWRALTQWLGGMGIVVLTMAILPLLGVGGMQLFKAETSGTPSDRLTPRIASSAKLLWGTYILLTVVLCVLLMFGGMSLFDAWCHSATAISTGGFSTRNTSILAFDSVYIECVMMVFMFLGSTNFVLHFRALCGKPSGYFKDEEFRGYLLLLVGATLIITLSLYTHHYYDRDILTILRHASFAVVTLSSTTGFGTQDFDAWPAFSRTLLLLLIIIGGCGNSTAGGMKLARVMMLAKYSLVQIKRSLFPRLIVNIHFNQQRINDALMDRILSFCFVHVALLITMSMMILFSDPALYAPSGIVHEPTLGAQVDAGRPAFSAFETAFSAVAATQCGVGPGLGLVGPTRNFGWMSDFSKLVLTLAMLIGRLEIYTVIVLLLPAFWRR